MTVSGNSSTHLRRAHLLSSSGSRDSAWRQRYGIAARGFFGVLFLAFVVVVVAVFLKQSADRWLSARAVTSGERSALESALARDPGNAELQYQLGLVAAQQEFDLEQGSAAFRRATEINPYIPRYWFELADAEQAQGRRSEALLALDRAVAADPKTPAVAWEAAQSYLVQGENERALQQFKTVLGGNASAFRDVLELSWQVTRDPERILSFAIFPSAEAHAAFIRLLIDESETDAALRVWDRMIALNQPFEPRLAFPLMKHLVNQNRGPDLARAWNDLARVNPGVPALGAENLIVNGGFEFPILNGGLSWRYSPHDQLTLEAVTGEAHEGTRAMQFTFRGPGFNDTGLYHHIPVQGGETYTLSAWVRADRIETASGPRLLIADAVTRTPIFATSDVIGSSGWQLMSGTFSVPESVTVLELRVNREKGGKLIKGALWLDDVRLVRSVQ